MAIVKMFDRKLHYLFLQLLLGRNVQKCVDLFPELHFQDRLILRLKEKTVEKDDFSPQHLDLLFVNNGSPAKQEALLQFLVIQLH